MTQLRRSRPPWLLLLLISSFILHPSSLLHAYPPVPHHVIYGIVRGELGDPIAVTNAQVILTTGAGVQIKTTVFPNLAPGVNYRLTVPLDSGLTADPYKPTALLPTVPFRLSVKIGTVTYLPIEMIGDYKNLGQPAGETRLDLTLGEDSDGDGLPDAWERAIIASLGGNRTLADIKPGDDADGDGMNNLNEYLAGTYAFDPQDGFSLKMTGFDDGEPMLEFTVLRGRTYTVLGSENLQQWTPLEFRQVGDTAYYDQLSSDNVRTIKVVARGKNFTPKFFKLQVQ